MLAERRLWVAVPRGQVSRYLLVGASSYALELATILALTGLGSSRVSSVAIAFWVGVIASFILQRTFAFGSRQRRASVIMWQSAAYLSLVAFNYVFTLTFVWVTSGFLPLLWSRTLALAATVSWNYLLYRHYIFYPSVAFRPWQWPESQQLIRKSLGVLVLIAPVILSATPILTSPANGLLAGDYDMQVQMTEAARVSIVEFHQFPQWNPWVSGGVPLFADPQFGLFTPQTLFSLFIGSIAAWKITIVIYLCVGVVSMKQLLSHIDPSPSARPVHILLSCCWIFSSFFALRASGHFTFLILALLPLAVWLYLKIEGGTRYVLGLAGLIAYCLNAALHYSTILILLVLFGMSFLGAGCQLAGYVISGEPRRGSGWGSSLREVLRGPARLVAATAAAVVVSLPRLLLTFQYMGTNGGDRVLIPEPYVGVRYGFALLSQPDSKVVAPEASAYSVFEGSNNIGALTVAVFMALALAVIVVLVTPSELREAVRHRAGLGRLSRLAFLFTSMGALSFFVALGGAPFEMVRAIPVMSFTRASTRYLYITAFAIIVLVAVFLALVAERAPALRTILSRIVGAALLVSAMTQFLNAHEQHEAFWSGAELLVLDGPSDHIGPPRSERLWHFRPEFYFALTEATKANRAQLYADNALVDTRVVATQRCDEDKEPSDSCTFVLTHNAEVRNWTPNGFDLHRLSPGQIRLNMNIGSSWSINGAYPFNGKAVVSDAFFTVPADNLSDYHVAYAPRASMP